MQGSAGGGDDIVFYAGDPAGAGKVARRAPRRFSVCPYKNALRLAARSSPQSAKNSGRENAGGLSIRVCAAPL